jgi:hypothetical protein
MTRMERCFQHASDEGRTLGNVVAKYNSRMGCESMNVSLDQGHRNTPVDTTRNPSVSSTFPRISCTPTGVQYPQYQAQRFQELEKRPIAAPSRSTSPYSCDICGKAYAQPQGVRRHHREVHDVKICTYCGDFKWGRPYQFRKHLKKQHPSVDPDAVVGRPSESHRKVAMIPKHPPQQQVLPPIPEHDRQGRTEPRLRAPAQLPSAVAELLPFSQPFISSLDYHPQPEHAEPMNTTDLDATYAYVSSVSSTEEHAQRANDSEIAFQNWLAPVFFNSPHM